MLRCIKKHKLQLPSFFATSADEANLREAAKLDLKPDYRPFKSAYIEYLAETNADHLL